MNIQQIETEFDDKHIGELDTDNIKQFYRSKITELLKSTKLTEHKITAKDDQEGWTDLYQGYNQAVSDQDKKINEAIN